MILKKTFIFFTTLLLSSEVSARFVLARPVVSLPRNAPIPEVCQSFLNQGPGSNSFGYNTIVQPESNNGGKLDMSVWPNNLALLNQDGSNQLPFGIGSNNINSEAIGLQNPSIIRPDIPGSYVSGIPSYSQNLPQIGSGGAFSLGNFGADNIRENGQGNSIVRPDISGSYISGIPSYTQNSPQTAGGGAFSLGNFGADNIGETGQGNSIVRPDISGTYVSGIPFNMQNSPKIESGIAQYLYPNNPSNGGAFSLGNFGADNIRENGQGNSIVRPDIPGSYVSGIPFNMQNSPQIEGGMAQYLNPNNPSNGGANSLGNYLTDMVQRTGQGNSIVRPDMTQSYVSGMPSNMQNLPLIEGGAPQYLLPNIPNNEGAIGLGSNGLDMVQTTGPGYVVSPNERLPGMMTGVNSYPGTGIISGSSQNLPSVGADMGSAGGIGGIFGIRPNTSPQMPSSETPNGADSSVGVIFDKVNPGSNGNLPNRDALNNIFMNQWNPAVGGQFGVGARPGSPEFNIPNRDGAGGLGSSLEAIYNPQNSMQPGTQLGFGTGGFGAGIQSMLPNQNGVPKGATGGFSVESPSVITIGEVQNPPFGSGAAGQSSGIGGANGRYGTFGGVPGGFIADVQSPPLGSGASGQSSGIGGFSGGSDVFGIVPGSLSSSGEAQSSPFGSGAAGQSSGNGRITGGYDVFEMPGSPSNIGEAQSSSFGSGAAGSGIGGVSGGLGGGWQVIPSNPYAVGGVNGMLNGENPSNINIEGVQNPSLSFDNVGMKGIPSNIGIGEVQSPSLSFGTGGQGPFSYLNKEQSGGTENSSSSVKASGAEEDQGGLRRKAFTYQQQHQNQRSNFHTKVQQITVGKN